MYLDGIDVEQSLRVWDEAEIDEVSGDPHGPTALHLRERGMDASSRPMMIFIIINNKLAL